MTEHQRDLPLFPLNTVLFPGGTLPLHVFEARYRAMLRLCLDGDRRFGVVLIAEGQEVGATATPHASGTVALIQQADPQPDGRYFVIAAGEQRFRLSRTWLADEGYLMGHVTLRDDQYDLDMEQLATLTSQVRATLTAYVTRLSPDATTLQRELAQLNEPLRLAGLAAMILRIDNSRKQELIEIDSVPTRLRWLLTQLRRELAVLDLLARPAPDSLRDKIISTN